MFEGFDRSAIDFLWGIRLNNDKNWYESHKDEYRQNLAKPMNRSAMSFSAIFTVR